MPKNVRIVALSFLLASCAHESVDPSSRIETAQFSSRASFARNGYIEHFVVKNDAGEPFINIACYSLDDEGREQFALAHGTDPVADLSCYAKDLSREREYTMLALEGESLQFTPAFFWFTDVVSCSPNRYRLDATLRRVHISFEFARIDEQDKSADLVVRVLSMPTATNDRLSADTFQAGCRL